jgi:integrase
MGLLNDAKIRAAKPEPREDGNGIKDQTWLSDGDGLWLRIRAGGSKVFVLRSKANGKSSMRTLGKWPRVTLQAARLEAAKHAHHRSRGELRPELPPVTVKELADEYFERRIGRRYKRVKNAIVYRDRLIAALGTRRASQVRAFDVASVVKAYAQRHPVAANRFLAFTKQCFAYGVQSGQLEHSPVAVLTAAVAGGEERARDRTLSDAELRLLWHADSEHTRLMRLLLLSGARIGELQMARWEHFDAKARRWTIPAAHAKNKRATWVHLTDTALALLGAPGEPNTRAMRCVSLTATQNWMRRWCERNGIAEPFTPHDLRRTFASRLGDLGVAPHVIRACINHVEPGSLSVYLRSDFAPERIAATEAWAAELRRIVGA